MATINIRIFSILPFVLLLLLAGPEAGAAGLEADMVIYNAKILTIDSPDPENFSIAQAAAIYDGKFVAVGTNEEVLAYAGPSTRKLDLAGRTVIPGLVETHNHIFGYGSHFFPEGSEQVGSNAAPVSYPNKEEFLAQVRTLAFSKKPGEWIVTTLRAGGLGSESSTQLKLALQRTGDLTRFDLDKVLPNNPFYLHWDSSMDALVNTKALEPILERYPDLPGVRRDDAGVPTGSLTGVANVTSWMEFWPTVPAEHLGPYYKMEMEEMAAQGITSLSTRLSPNQLAGYAWLRARNEMPIRMGFSFQGVARINNPEAIFARMLGLQVGSGDNMWGIGDDLLWIMGMAATFSIDGVPGNAGSCVSKPYPREVPDFPAWRYQLYGPYGLCRLADPDYRDAEGLKAAAKYGFRISAMHTGGDRGIDLFLDIVEEMAAKYPDLTQRRWSIDHCRFLSEQQAVRAKKYNIMFSCGPKYVYAGEKGDIGAFSVLYGKEIAQDSVVPFRRILDHGMRATMQLDQHGFHPFLALETAITRKDINGVVWGPQQRINRREALYTYTRWSSEYLLREDKLGSIEPRRLADFVVLDRDYLTVPEDEIGQIDPLLTVMGGNFVYTEPEFARSMGLPQAGFRGNPTWWLRGVAADKDARRR